MKLSLLVISGLPKSFQISEVVDELNPDWENMAPEELVYDEYPAYWDEKKGLEASIVFKYYESSTGVLMEHNSKTQTLKMSLSPWAVGADVQLYADLINLILKKHPRAKLFEKDVRLEGITDKDVERMTNDRKNYLKKLLTTKDEICMDGLNCGFTLCPHHLRPAPTIDMQVFELQQNFVNMQWEFEEYDDEDDEDEVVEFPELN